MFTMLHCIHSNTFKYTKQVFRTNFEKNSSRSGRLSFFFWRVWIFSFVKSFEKFNGLVGIVTSFNVGSVITWGKIDTVRI